jgi:uncharacterized DUF497 family protein
LTVTADIIIERLEWDSFNTEHILKHGLSREEVEQACNNILQMAVSYSHRWRAICELPNDQIITIILASKGNNTYYPISARPASRKERLEVNKTGGEPIQ